MERYYIQCVDHSLSYNTLVGTLLLLLGVRSKGEIAGIIDLGNDLPAK
jgi:hypothetical protein